MRSYYLLASVMILGLGIAGHILRAGDAESPVIPKSAVDVPRVSASESKAVAKPAVAHDPEAALGKLLFSNVTRVSFIGPGHPANSDGTLGGLVADDGFPLAIYERFIVRGATDAEGRVYRSLHPYVTLGVIEQAILPKGVIQN